MRGLVALAGVVFLLAGMAGLVHPRLKMPPKHSEIWVRGQKLKIETQQILEVPAILCGLAIVAGSGFVFLGLRKPR
jgi:hypothetical protein